MSNSKDGDIEPTPAGSPGAASRSRDAAVLELLIETYGQDWCPSDSSNNRKAITLAEMSMVSRATLAAILSGKSKGRRRADTLKALSNLFCSLDPNLPANCFLRTEYENVRSACAAYTAKNPPDKAVNVPRRENIEAVGPYDVLSLKIPGYTRTVADVKQNLLGTYVTYRYAFERGNSEDGVLIAREVLHVEKNGPDLAFKLSFCRNMGDRDPDPQWFTGRVIPFDESALFVGFDFPENRPSRGRTVFIPKISFGPLRNCNIGLLSGMRMHEDYGPAASCMLLFRAPTLQGENRVIHFIKSVTRNEPVNTVMNQDFGGNVQHHRWIRSFLDNRPAGTDKEAELAELEKIDGNTERPIEAALRVDVARFERRMPRLLAELTSATDVNAPFKDGWRPEMPRSRRRRIDQKAGGQLGPAV